MVNRRSRWGDQFTNLSSGGYFFRARPGNEHVARSALLQEQLGGLHHGLGMETSAHRAIVQQVCNGNEGHSLMMREKCAHDGDRFAFGQACACVIERFIKSVRAASARFFQAAKVLQGRSWDQSWPQARWRRVQ